MLGLRVVAVEEAGPEDEVLVLGQGHVRVLCRRLRRVERDHVAQIAAAHPREVDPPRPVAGSLGLRLALGCHAAVRPGVHVRLDRDANVRPLDLGPALRARPVHLLIALP